MGLDLVFMRRLASRQSAVTPTPTHLAANGNPSLLLAQHLELARLRVAFRRPSGASSLLPRDPIVE